MDRAKLEAALAKPLPDDPDMIHAGVFDPWCDVLSGIHGSYSSESDTLMIEALEASRDRRTFDLIEARGFVAEFALYVLSGHGLTDYGTSPRGGWPEHEIKDLWQPLINKWRSYAAIVWGDPSFNLKAPQSPTG